MTDIKAGQIAGLYRYPVKGLPADRLSVVQLESGATLPFDRAWAVLNGPGPFPVDAPVHAPKLHFVMLMRNEQLAGFELAFDDETRTLRLSHEGQVVVEGDLATPAARAALAEAVREAVGPGLRGDPIVAEGNGHSFSDVADKCVHIISLESVRALADKIGAEVDPMRFRPNIIVEGWPAWSEFDLVGRRLQAGGATLEVFKRTERCAATNVNPKTAARDLKIPSFLSRTYGHTDFGIYARVVSGGKVATGDKVGPA